MVEHFFHISFFCEIDQQSLIMAIQSRIIRVGVGGVVKYCSHTRSEVGGMYPVGEMPAGSIVQNTLGRRMVGTEQSKR
jgi:hypothetical protein